MSVFLLILLIAALGVGYAYYKDYRRHYWMMRCLSNVNVLMDAHLISQANPDHLHLKDNIIDDLNRLIVIVQKQELFPDVQEFAVDYIEKARNRYIALINLRKNHAIDVTV